jgi:vacuolar-type H+-ATPase subunit H
MTKGLDPFDLRPDDPMVRYRREAAEREEAAARERRAEEHERREREQQHAQRQQNDAVEALREEMRQGLEEMRMRAEVGLEVTSDEMVKCADKIYADFDKLILETKDALFAYADRKFAELQGRIDGILDASSTRRFRRFANEAVEPDDDLLPNWRSRDKMN